MLATWKLEMTRPELREYLAAIGYSRVPQSATRAAMLEVIRQDEVFGVVKERWY